MIRLGILGSTKGSHLSAIVDAIQQEQIAASIEVVISNKSDAFILGRAQQLEITACFINPDGLSRESYDSKISALLQKCEVELVVLIGYMRILSSVLIDAWRNKIINVHPSLLPKHAGKMDLAVHRAVLAAKEKETGCTVHYVTEEVDAGPIIVQKTCSVQSEDTPEALKERVQKLETQALIQAIHVHYMNKST